MINIYLSELLVKIFRKLSRKLPDSTKMWPGDVSCKTLAIVCRAAAQCCTGSPPDIFPDRRVCKKNVQFRYQTNLERRLYSETWWITHSLITPAPPPQKKTTSKYDKPVAINLSLPMVLEV